MKTPAFSHMGGKARLRKWLLQYFPDSGRRYCEPFAGKANVYFAARLQLQFTSWMLADIDPRFLIALSCANFDKLPDSVSKDEFSFWVKAASVNGDLQQVSWLIEPRITYAGKGYRYGYNGSSGTHVGYSGSNYRKVCEAARGLIQGVSIWQRSWESMLPMLEAGDFAYLDPPYYETLASFENVDHVQLIDALNTAKFDWAISGYRSDLYDTRLEFKCRFECERNSEIKSSNSGKREGVIETLWTNYEL